MSHKFPKNIVIWTLPRSGSTHLQYRIATGQRIATKNVNTRNLQEVGGTSGILRAHWGVGYEVNFDDAINGSTNEIALLDYVRWTINEENNLVLADVHGNPLDEIKSRSSIIKNMTWSNPVVMKNMRWSREANYPEKLNELFDKAFLESTGEQYHHIVLWRRSPQDLMSSRLAIGMAKRSHGEYQWLGQTFRFADDYFEEQFTAVSRRHFTEFVTSTKQLPFENTILIETNAMNDISRLEWPDGAVLDLPSKESLPPNRNGSSSYTYAMTGQKVKPIDMMAPETIGVIEMLANEAESKLSWSALGATFGFKSYLANN